MRYRIEWDPNAEETLARLWMEYVEEQRSIATASDRAESLLRSDPLRLASPCDGLWRIKVSPLSILFEFVPDDCLVRIVGVSFMHE